MPAKKYVAYYRVSTQRQGASGLGLEAQRQAVADHLNGGDWDLVEEYTEVETGKGRNALNRRPQLQAAINRARREKAVLVIAKLDRLARNVAFISDLMEGDVEFHRRRHAVSQTSSCCTSWPLLPSFERDQTSARTKAALAAAKARGVELGKNGRVLAERNRQEADAFAGGVAGVVEAIRADGIATVRGITDELNRRQVPTARGGQWHVASVHRLMKRLTLSTKGADSDVSLHEDQRVEQRSASL